MPTCCSWRRLHALAKQQTCCFATPGRANRTKVRAVTGDEVDLESTMKWLRDLPRPCLRRDVDGTLSCGQCPAPFSLLCFQVSSFFFLFCFVFVVLGLWVVGFSGFWVFGLERTSARFQEVVVGHRRCCHRFLSEANIHVTLF